MSLVILFPPMVMLYLTPIVMVLPPLPIFFYFFSPLFSQWTIFIRHHGWLVGCHMFFIHEILQNSSMKNNKFHWLWKQQIFSMHWKQEILFMKFNKLHPGTLTRIQKTVGHGREVPDFFLTNCHSVTDLPHTISTAPNTPCLHRAKQRLHCCNVPNCITNGERYTATFCDSGWTSGSMRRLLTCKTGEA